MRMNTIIHGVRKATKMETTNLKPSDHYVLQVSGLGNNSQCIGPHQFCEVRVNPCHMAAQGSLSPTSGYTDQIDDGEHDCKQNNFFKMTNSLPDINWCTIKTVPSNKSIQKRETKMVEESGAKYYRNKKDAIEQGNTNLAQRNCAQRVHRLQQFLSRWW